MCCQMNTSLLRDTMTEIANDMIFRLLELTRPTLLFLL